MVYLCGRLAFGDKSCGSWASVGHATGLGRYVLRRTSGRKLSAVLMLWTPSWWILGLYLLLEGYHPRKVEKNDGGLDARVGIAEMWDTSGGPESNSNSPSPVSPES